MTRALILSIIALMTLVTVTSSGGMRPQVLAENNQSVIPSLPPGPWTLGIQPAKTRGRIVDLSAVSSSLTTGLGVTDFTLDNRSKQDVAGVKIGWRLFETSHREISLLKGETAKFLAVPLTAGEKRKVIYPVVSFAEIYRPLLHGKRMLEGNYRIELWVSDIKFTGETGEQGSAALLNVKKVNWKADAVVAFLKVKSEPVPPRRDDELGCPHQVCHYDNSELCYRCVSEQSATCGWRDCKNCANGRCPGLID